MSKSPFNSGKMGMLSRIIGGLSDQADPMVKKKEEEKEKDGKENKEGEQDERGKKKKIEKRKELALKEEEGAAKAKEK